MVKNVYVRVVRKFLGGIFFGDGRDIYREVLGTDKICVISKAHLSGEKTAVINRRPTI
jgi:hypothetical protein